MKGFRKKIFVGNAMLCFDTFAMAICISKPHIETKKSNTESPIKVQ